MVMWWGQGQRRACIIVAGGLISSGTVGRDTATGLGSSAWLRGNGAGRSSKRGWPKGVK